MISSFKLICIKKFILFIEGSIWFKLGTVLISNLKSFGEAPLIVKNSSLNIKCHQLNKISDNYTYASVQVCNVADHLNVRHQ